MIDSNVLDKMVDYADISKKDTVFEFGAGSGNLTKVLCQRAGNVISYEIDEVFYKNAKENLKRFENLNLIQGDSLKSDHKFNKLVSNIPYSRSREFIEWLRKRDFEKAVVMVQKEFAEKLLTKNGANDYRAITVIARSSFNIKSLEEIGSDSFKPEPKVISILLLLEPKPEKPDENSISILKLLFSFRGKKLKGAIRAIRKNSNEKDDGFFNIFLKQFNNNILEKRIEQLSVEEVVKVANYLSNPATFYDKNLFKE